MNPALAVMKGYEVLESYSPFWELESYLARREAIGISARAFGLRFNQSLFQCPDGSYGSKYYLAVDKIYQPRVIPRFVLLAGTMAQNQFVPAKGWGVRKRWDFDWAYQF